MDRRKLICGNWKMNGLRTVGEALARRIAASAGGGGELAVCPPATLLALVGEALRGTQVALGAQDCHARAAGAFTGDIAAPMLADLGCRYVILGHSERRAGHRETDADVHAKALAARDAGLCAIVCVGESLVQRDAGQALAVVAAQLAGSVPDGAGAGNLVVAYEPVWAIGTGRTATPAQVGEVHAAIRHALAARFPEGRAMRILYGGSVKPDNAAALLSVADVDGALVGGASLDAAQFLAIAAAAGVR